MASLIPGFTRMDTVANAITGNRPFRNTGFPVNGNAAAATNGQVTSLTMNPPSPQVAGYGAIYTDGFTTPDLQTDASMRAPFAAYASPDIANDVTTVAANTDACWGGVGVSAPGIIV